MGRVRTQKRYPNTYQRRSVRFYQGSANDLPPRFNFEILQIICPGPDTLEFILDQKQIVRIADMNFDGWLINDSPFTAIMSGPFISGFTLTIDPSVPPGLNQIYIPQFWPYLRSPLGGYLPGSAFLFNVPE